MSVMQNSKSPTEIIVISDSGEDSPEDIIVISDDLEDSNQDGNTPDDPKPPQEEESFGAMGNNPVQDGPTSPTEYKDRRASSGLLRSKRPMSTPIRHSFDPIRIYKLRKSFRARASWIKNDSEFIPDATSDDKNKDSVSDAKEDIDDEVVDRKRKNLGSTIRRKRQRILRGAIRYYARYADSDSE